jgi:hypothetical protein
MHRAVIGLLIIFPIAMFSGCGGSPPVSKFTAPPHAGNIVELPDSLGFVELKTDRGAPPKKGSKERPNSQIVAYFYQPDGSAVMSPAPSEVKITLGAAGRGTIINLSARSNAAGEFASAPGNYPDELRGQIDFQLGGKPVQATFSFR